MKALQKDKMAEFLNTLESSIDTGGCNLKFIAKRIEEHYENKSERYKKYTIRLIGGTSNKFIPLQSAFN